MSMIATLLGATEKSIAAKKPPHSAIRRCHLANMDAQVGSVDTDDDSYSSFADLIDGLHPNTQKSLRCIATSIRRTGSISNAEMMHILQTEHSRMRDLWRILAAQGWVVREGKGGRSGLFYIQTDTGKAMFANLDHETLCQKAA